MIKHTRRLQAGFTLIELLTVIAIIGILAAIIIPTVANVQERARRTTDLSNMKQIVQSAIVYANDNNEKFPALLVRKLDGTAGTQANNPWVWGAVIAKGGGLNDPNFYISKSDPNIPATIPLTILNDTKTALNAEFGGTTKPELSVELVGGLRLADPSTTPIAFTRGLEITGKWSETKGVYKGEGGYIAFLGGNVSFYKDTLGEDGTGVLINATTGAKTVNIKQTLKTTNSIYGSTNAGIGSEAGTAGGN